MTVSVPACFFLGKGWRRGLFSKFTFAEALRTLATGSARKKKLSQKEVIAIIIFMYHGNMDTGIYMVFVNN